MRSCDRSSATIIAHVKRFCQAFKSDEVFDTHRGRKISTRSARSISSVAPSMSE
jgi:hypothetical protein